jgi:hypothetical protein
MDMDDEGLNPFFMEFMWFEEDELGTNFPSRRVSSKILSLMSGDQKWIRANYVKFWNQLFSLETSYGKPATGLNILRETIMEESCLTMLSRFMPTVEQHPTQKTFRTMEDASAVDLDWFLEAGFIRLICRT